MSNLLLVENDRAYADLLQRLLPDLGETAAIVTLNLVSEVEEAVTKDGFFDDYEVALVDLELGPAADAGPGDYLGRDTILPLLRRHAPWLPVILVSRYVSGTDDTLYEVSPFGFDAIVPKSFFSSRSIYRKEWQEVRRRASLNRIAGLTGRYVAQLSSLLGQTLQVEYGRNVAKSLAHFDETEFKEILRLLDLGSERLVLDEIVPGFSGLCVVKGTCHTSTRRTSWLLKFGPSIAKLSRELTAHRKMFADGVTRRISVPPFWWAPICWKSLGVIAYEFEEGAETLLEVCNRTSLVNVMREIRPSLAELYKGSTADMVIPRNYFKHFVAHLAGKGDASRFGPMVAAILKDTPHETIDRSALIGAGSEHGDLHSRNIMIGPGGPVLIDFAHYRSRSEGGVPLGDLARLLVDLWAFDASPDSIDNLLDLSVVKQEYVTELLDLFTHTETKALDDDERRFLSLAVECNLALYSQYDGVHLGKRKNIEEKLRSRSSHSTASK